LLTYISAGGIMINKNIEKDFFKNRFIKSAVFLLMCTAFIFGYLHLFANHGFERLHIFLFNLTVGGSIILYYSETRSVPSLRVIVFFFLSIVYAISAFFEIYALAIIITVTLSLIVESIRIKTFSFFPRDFFRKDADLPDKFHQASLLCLSMALMTASFVIMNNEYFHWVHFEKLKLNVFFLGFSFPVSLITMSVMFSFINRIEGRLYNIMAHYFFWSINLGVISFFAFIIFEIFPAEFMAALILFISVIMIFIYFIKFGISVQQKHFLVSGMGFLLSTAITGLLYLLLYLNPELHSKYGKNLLSIHAYLSLYGWNLSGLMVILRWNDFPLKLNTFQVISLHWILIGILAPFGKFYVFFAIISIILYTCLLLIFFSGRNTKTDAHI
jgi:hypothetical protein